MGKTLVTAQLVSLCYYRKVSSLGLVGLSQDILSAGKTVLVFLALMYIVASNSLLGFPLFCKHKSSFPSSLGLGIEERKGIQSKLENPNLVDIELPKC